MKVKATCAHKLQLHDRVTYLNTHTHLYICTYKRQLQTAINVAKTQHQIVNMSDSEITKPQNI